MTRTLVGRSASAALDVPVEKLRQQPGSAQQDQFDDDRSSLRSLVAGAAAGDEAAFVDLYDRTHTQVYGVALRVLRTADHAVEVTQETYLEVWLKSGSYDPARASVFGWLTMIVYRRAVDRVRTVEASRARDTHTAHLDHALRAVDEWDDVTARLDTHHLHHAFQQLSPIQRQAVTLKYLDGYSLQQIADQLTLPLGTVKTRVRDGLRHLRHHLTAANPRSA